MNNYSQIVAEIYSILEHYELKDDLLYLEKTKSRLTALKALLYDMYQTCNEGYVLSKEKLDCTKVETYKERRDAGDNVEDSKNESKLITIDLLKEANKMRLKRDKSLGLHKQLEDMCIELAVNIKKMRNDIKYG